MSEYEEINLSRNTEINLTCYCGHLIKVLFHFPEMINKSRPIAKQLNSNFAMPI